MNNAVLAEPARKLAAKLRLVVIRQDGSPERCPGVMPPAARDACEGTARFYETIGFKPPWIGYLADYNGEAVGTCAFKGPPRRGEVEIAYHTFAAWEGRGVAAEMARQMVEIARAENPRIVVIAQTLPEENASTAILRRLRFKLEGPVEHPEDGTVWQWRLEP